METPLNSIVSCVPVPVWLLTGLLDSVLGVDVELEGVVVTKGGTATNVGDIRIVNGEKSLHGE